MIKIKIFAIVFFVALISGCVKNSTTKDSDGSSYVTTAKINSSLFATLDNKNGDYYFSQFTTKLPEILDSAWVDLSTGEPLWNTQAQRCGKGLIKDRNKKVLDCSEVVNDTLFLESDFDEGDAVTRVFGSVVTMGLTLTGVSYDVIFNDVKYSEAYESAFKKLKADEIHMLSKTLNRIDTPEFVS